MKKCEIVDKNVKGLSKPSIKPPLAVKTRQPLVNGVKRLNSLPKSINVNSSLKKPCVNGSILPKPSGPLKAGLNSTLGALPRGKQSKEEFQKPTMMRQGSSLTQPKVGMSRFSTPSSKGPSYNRSVDQKRSALPSPQVISSNSSLVCSTPTAVRPRQAKSSLPSPISNVKRRF